MKRTISEINEKIRRGQAVAVTAEEIIDMVEKDGAEKTLAKVDVVTTGTFSPMCSSGVFFNFGHNDPPMKMNKTTLNGVNAYAGIAAVDAYLGAAELKEGLRKDEPLYGGANVIESLLRGEEVKLDATGYVTDCYPGKECHHTLTLDSINEAIMFNPRNAYQNYAAAVNGSNKTIYTYMGILYGNYKNMNYATSGQLSPLLNDPLYRTIGVGTKIFLGGAQGFVAWQGTQFNAVKERKDNGVPVGPAGTLSLIGNLKEMSPDYIQAAIMARYGVSMYVGMGIPIPLLDEEILKNVCIKDEDIYTTIVDYSVGRLDKPSHGLIDYKSLKSGQVSFMGKEVKTAPMSSMRKAREIAETLKDWIHQGTFILTEPSRLFPLDASLSHLGVSRGDLGE